MYLIVLQYLCDRLGFSYAYRFRKLSCGEGPTYMVRGLPCGNRSSTCWPVVIGQALGVSYLLKTHKTALVSIYFQVNVGTYSY